MYSPEYTNILLVTIKSSAIGGFFPRSSLVDTQPLQHLGSEELVTRVVVRAGSDLVTQGTGIHFVFSDLM